MRSPQIKAHEALLTAASRSNVLLPPATPMLGSSVTESQTHGHRIVNQPAKTEVVHLDDVRASRTGDRVGRRRSSREQGLDGDLETAAVTAAHCQLIAAKLADAGEPDAARKTRSARSFRLTVAASLLLHAAVFGILVWNELVMTPGAGGRELEAVSVEIISAAALESLSSRPSPASGGATANIDQTPGQFAPAEQVEVVGQMAAVQPDTQERPPEALVKAEPSPAPAEVATAEIVTADLKPIEPPKDRERPEKPKEAVIEPGSDSIQTPAQLAMVSGGSASRSASESESVDGSAGAGAGQLTRYAVDVRLAIGRSRPRHDGGRGQVQIGFGLDETGIIRFAEVAKSSGSDRLDNVALRAIRTVKFPTPPAGMTDAQRSYVVPFEFR